MGRELDKAQRTLRLSWQFDPQWREGEDAGENHQGLPKTLRKLQQGHWEEMSEHIQGESANKAVPSLLGTGQS